jgi:hypothetical protein
MDGWMVYEEEGEPAFKNAGVKIGGTLEGK